VAPPNCLLVKFLMELADSKTQAIYLRTERRLSIKEIASQLEVSTSTVSLWLRGHPLTEEERQSRQSANGVRQGGWNKKDRGVQSKYHQIVELDNLSNARKGRIAESAVLFRLALHGFSVHAPLFDGDRADWVVENPRTGRLSRLQVRWVHEPTHGLPTISIQCFEGHSGKKKYGALECDVIVGYDLFTDTAYVFRYSDLEHLASTVTVIPEAAENWSVIL